jgi:hypothetical protein
MCTYRRVCSCVRAMPNAGLSTPAICGFLNCILPRGRQKLAVVCVAVCEPHLAHRCFGKLKILALVKLKVPACTVYVCDGTTKEDAPRPATGRRGQQGGVVGEGSTTDWLSATACARCIAGFVQAASDRRTLPVHVTRLAVPSMILSSGFSKSSCLRKRVYSRGDTNADTDECKRVGTHTDDYQWYQ